VKFTLRGTGQGAILGPIIFSVYINDLPLVVKHCLCILFADDSQLIISGSPKQLPLILERLREDLLRVMEWMRLNGLKLNVEKTQLSTRFG
jgi:hypothetical protein